MQSPCQDVFLIRYAIVSYAFMGIYPVTFPYKTTGGWL